MRSTLQNKLATKDVCSVEEQDGVHSWYVSHDTITTALNTLTDCYKQAVRLGRHHNMPPPHFDLLTLKSVWESHVTWGTLVQSFVFLGLLVFELEPMYATSDRQTDG